MAGQLIRVLPRTDYDISGLGSGSSEQIVIARKIDTSHWIAGVLEARLHAVTWPPGALIQVVLAPDGFTDDDPGAAWNTSGTTLLQFQQSSDTAPAAKTAALSAPFGPLVQIQLFFQNAVGSTGTFKPSLSIDLNLNKK